MGTFGWWTTKSRRATLPSNTPSGSFLSSIPRKLDLVEGHIPGEQKLVLFLLATMRLERVAALVGRERWLAAVEDEG
jgi:hypothetical protein